MPTPLPADVDLSEGIPCEYRLLHISSGKFLSAGGDGKKPRYVNTWQEASYYGSSDHHKDTGDDTEGTLKFQWEWMRDECDEEWMHAADMNDYRVHVLIGDSGL